MTNALVPRNFFLRAGKTVTGWSCAATPIPSPPAPFASVFGLNATTGMLRNVSSLALADAPDWNYIRVTELL